MSDLKSAADKYVEGTGYLANSYRLIAKDSFLAGADHVLKMILESGCPHGCAPPCPFHRKIQAMKGDGK